jgi:hypothetical protein
MEKLNGLFGDSIRAIRKLNSNPSGWWTLSSRSVYGDETFYQDSPSVQAVTKYVRWIPDYRA